MSANNELFKLQLPNGRTVSVTESRQPSGAQMTTTRGEASMSSTLCLVADEEHLVQEYPDMTYGVIVGDAVIPAKRIT